MKEKAALHHQHVPKILKQTLAIDIKVNTKMSCTSDQVTSKTPVAREPYHVY